MPGKYLNLFHTKGSPGRFFAVNEVKVLLAFVLLKYDIKFKDGIRPADTCFMGQPVPHTTAEVLFRRRK